MSISKFTKAQQGRLWCISYAFSTNRPTQLPIKWHSTAQLNNKVYNQTKLWIQCNHTYRNFQKTFRKRLQQLTIIIWDAYLCRIIIIVFYIFDRKKDLTLEFKLLSITVFLKDILQWNFSVFFNEILVDLLRMAVLSWPALNSARLHSMATVINDSQPTSSLSYVSSTCN